MNIINHFINFRTTEKQQFSILNFRETDNVDFTNVPSVSLLNAIL